MDSHHYTDRVCPTSATRAVVCGEYGGVGLPVTNHIWGTGFEYTTVADSNALTTKFEDMGLQLSDLVGNNGLSAAVYTQITDVESELNGFLTYDRQVRKKDADRIRSAIDQAGTTIAVPALMPSSQIAEQTWKYTTTTPASNWFTSGSSDTAWSSGPGAFGTIGARRAVWNTADIWLRRNFNPSTLTPSQLPNLRFSVFRDEDTEIYINGVLAASIGGYYTNYALFALTAAGRNAILSNATNVISVDCRQTSGGQFLDVGLSVLQGGVVVPPRPVPLQPITLFVKNGKFVPSVGWSAVANATTYQIKRSLSSGGPYTNLLISSPINAVTNTGVTNGVTYYYVISAMNASGESANSVEISVTAVVTPPPLVPQPTLAAWFKADALGYTNGKLLAGTGSPEVTIASTGSTFNNGAAHVAVFKRTKATGLLDRFADGIAQGTATGGVQSLTAPASLVLGSHLVLNNYLTGDIAEVKIYDGIISDVDRSAVSSALAFKYGIGPAVAARAPADFLAVAGNLRATLSWIPVMEANSYTVSWSATPDGPFTPIAQNLTSSNFVDLNAAPGKTNYYKVTAYNES